MRSMQSLPGGSNEVTKGCPSLTSHKTAGVSSEECDYKNVHLEVCVCVRERERESEREYTKIGENDQESNHRTRSISGPNLSRLCKP